MALQLGGHVRRHLVGRCFRHAIRDVADVLLRCPERDVDDQPAPLRDHRRRGELTGAVVRPNAGAEHRIPPPERLFPEWPGPRELAVVDHALVAAPHVVDQDVDSGGTRAGCVRRPRRPARPRDGRTDAVTAVSEAFVIRCRTAGDVDARTALGELACDASADASRRSGHHRDLAVQTHVRNCSDAAVWTYWKNVRPASAGRRLRTFRRRADRAPPPGRDYAPPAAPASAPPRTPPAASPHRRADASPRPRSAAHRRSWRSARRWPA